MYMVKGLLPTNEITRYVCSDTESLFHLIWMMDYSDSFKAWRIVEGCPEEFGWAPLKDWNKGRREFLPEDFKNPLRRSHEV